MGGPREGLTSISIWFLFDRVIFRVYDPHLRRYAYVGDGSATNGSSGRIKVELKDARKAVTGGDPTETMGSLIAIRRRSHDNGFCRIIVALFGVREDDF